MIDRIDRRNSHDRRANVDRRSGADRRGGNRSHLVPRRVRGDRRERDHHDGRRTTD